MVGALEPAARRHEDDRKLEPLGLVHRHDAHDVVALVGHLRLGRLRLAAGRGRAPQPIGERAQIAAARLELARLLDQAHQVGHALLAVGRRGQDGHEIAVVDDGLRARRRAQAIGDAAAAREARAEALEPVALGRRQRLGQRALRVEQHARAQLAGERQARHRLVGDADDGRAQQRHQRQQIVGIVDDRERARQIAHLLRGEEAAAAHDEVRQRRGAQRVEVVVRDA